jgi:nucleotide-binding universal stress UspA family protein
MALPTETLATAPILLATDLSARCDRALDRAIEMSRRSGAPLVVLHVLVPTPDTANPAAPSWRRLGNDHRDMARYRLGLDLDHAGVQADIRIESGDASELIHQTAQSTGCGLIITGIAHDESLGKLLLGSTVKKLIRHVDVPVLVVKNRPHGPYGQAVVATDFSPESRHALRTAAALLPQAALTLFHAYDTAFGMRRDAETVPERLKEDAQHEARRFMQETPDLPPGVPAQTIIQYGEPETLLSEYVFQNRCDLVVVGTQRIKGIMGAMVGSVAQRLLEALPSDVLLVRAPDAS